jgi:hypothetical protein
MRARCALSGASAVLIALAACSGDDSKTSGPGDAGSDGSRADATTGNDSGSDAQDSSSGLESGAEDGNIPDVTLYDAGDGGRCNSLANQ